MSESPKVRALRAIAAAHQSWANTADPAARTAPARKAALDRFEKQVDPEGVLPPQERARRAHHARQAHMTAMAAKSVEARARKKKR